MSWRNNQATSTDREHRGAAYVVSGSVAGTAGLASAVARLRGFAGTNYAGFAVTAGDQDADGFADVAVGAPGSDEGAEDGGSVYVLYGPVEGTLDLSLSDAWIAGGEAMAGAGRALRGGVDHNGDGFDELLVGAPDQAEGRGAVHLVMGQGM
jgi:hypothetical protein